MNTLSVTMQALTHALAWALVYSVWQGALIYGTLYIVLKALPNVNARVKYYLSYGSLTALCIWFVNTWGIHYQKLKEVTIYITQPVAETGINTTHAIKTIVTNQGSSTQLHHLLPRLEQYFPFVIIVYTIGLVFMLLRFAVNIMQVRALRKKGIVVPEAQWVSFLAQLQLKSGLANKVQLLLSERVNVPMVMGILKPVIILPIAMISHLSVEQAEAILLHELAHIKRHDYLLNMLQTIAETVLFFNPFVWLVSKIVRREREHCCDDMVIAVTANPLPYATALAMLEQARQQNSKLALAATGEKQQLFNRIKRIMEMKKNNVNYSQLTIIIVAIIAIAITVTTFSTSRSFAQKAKTSQSVTTKKNSYRQTTITMDSNGKKKVVIKESNEPIKEKKEDDGSDSAMSFVELLKEVINDEENSERAGQLMVAHSKMMRKMYGNDGIGKDYDPIKELELANKELDGTEWGQLHAEMNKCLIEGKASEGFFDLYNTNSTKAELKQVIKDIVSTKKEIIDNPRIQLLVAYLYSDMESASMMYNTKYILHEMLEDKLIDSLSDFKVQKGNDELYINGKKQPKAVYEKYNAYLKNNKTFFVEGKNNGITNMWQSGPTDLQ